MSEEQILATIEQKLDKGEALTPEETKFIMGLPADAGQSNKSAVIADDEDAFANIEEIDEKEDEKKEEVKKEKPAEKVEEKTKEKAEPDKDGAADSKQTKEDDEFFARLERELEKPAGEEDLSTFTKREKAYFWQMRRDRAARQKAEHTADTLRLEKLRQEAEKQKPQEEEEPDIKKVLAGKDKDDFVSVAELEQIITQQKPKAKPTEKTETNAGLVWQQEYLRRCDEIAAERYKDDYVEVMECADDIVAKNPDYLKRVNEALLNRENPAVVMYNLIKSDGEFETAHKKAVARLKSRNYIPASEKKEEAEKKETQQKAERVEKKIEENINKPKTSGHFSGGEGNEADVMTLDKLAKMPDNEFFAMPKKKRDALLKKFGV